MKYRETRITEYVASAMHFGQKKVPESMRFSFVTEPQMIIRFVGEGKKCVLCALEGFVKGSDSIDFESNRVVLFASVCCGSVCKMHLSFFTTAGVD